MGQASTAMYLLICDEHAQDDVETDLRAEVEAQLGVRLPVGLIEEMFLEDVGFGPDDTNPIRLLRIDRWSPELIGLLDTHVVRLERTGAQFLFLTTDKLSEQLLKAAPNFRNRLTEIMRILPDGTLGDALN